MSPHESTPPITSVQLTASLPDGSRVTVTQQGPGRTAREREELILAAIDTLLSTRIRVDRTLAPIGSGVPWPAAPCENPDPEDWSVAS